MLFVANKELDRMIKVGIEGVDNTRSFKAIADVVLNTQKAEREEAKLMKDLGLDEEELKDIIDE